METTKNSSQWSERLVHGALHQPKDILGWHRLANTSDRVIVRTWKPGSSEVRLRLGNTAEPQRMKPILPEGLFEAEVRGDSAEHVVQGQYEFEYLAEGQSTIMPDPYSAPSLLGPLDLHLFSEGNHYRIYDRLGAHVRTVNGQTGVNFGVWAPNARQVSLVGSFNAWDGRCHPMQNVNSSGVWELFIPNAQPGDLYKFRVTSPTGIQTDKSDPFAFYAELPPRTASVVHDLNQYAWSDQAWMENRRTQDQMNRPISVYELHLGSWRQRAGRPHGWMNYRDVAHEIIAYCKQMNFTHIELMPIAEHPYTGSWGYQITGYFAATSRYGNPDDLMYFIDQCHQNDLGVIIDWVPAHFPKDAHGLARFDGTALFEHADPRQGEHPDWNTLIFNYGRNEVRNFLVANALFWLDKYHIDGLRVDAVASMLYLDYSRKDGEWVPNHLGGRENLAAIAFLKQFNQEAHLQFPGVLTIAEESTAWGGVSRPVDVGGLGFSIKWNMGWMNDSLRYMRHNPIHRKFHHDELTFSLVYAFSENFMLPLSHDEVVHGKRSLISQMPGDDWQKFANLRLLYTYMWTHPGKKLLFMGGELAQWHEWNCNAELDWKLLEFENHRGIQHLVADLNRVYRNEPALHELDFDGAGFEWIDCLSRDDSRLVYVRKGRDGNPILVACNFTPVVRHGLRIGVAMAGGYQEILNSDSTYYGGANIGNAHVLNSEAVPCQGRSDSISITLPPMAAVILKRV